MARSESPWIRLWKRANDVVLAPFIVAPSIGVTALHATIGGTARLGELAAKAAATVGVPLAGAAEDLARRTGDRTLGVAKEAVEILGEAAQKPIVITAHTANNLLRRTLIRQGWQTLTLPLATGYDTVQAAREAGPIRDLAGEVWLLLNRGLDTWSIRGVIPGRLGTQTNADVRFGYVYMTTEGPLGAVARDVGSIIGGFLALGLGDFEKLAKELPRYWANMEYVYDKKIHGEVQPESDFPIGATLAADGATTIRRFPAEFAQALDTGDPLEVLRATFRNQGLLATLLVLFPRVEFNVVYDVSVKVVSGYGNPGDAQCYALCELAIMESTLSDEQKDEALGYLRETANYNVVEFEYYVPLLVASDGSEANRAHRRNAAGEPIADTAIAPSVFNQDAIDRAQAINSEVFSLRSFLWLYGDEQIARKKNRGQTIMKFGQEAADRIEAEPLYPLSAEEIATLTQAGRRSQGEINAIFVDLLHQRGLEQVSSAVSAHLPQNAPETTKKQRAKATPSPRSVRSRPRTKKQLQPSPVQ